MTVYLLIRENLDNLYSEVVGVYQDLNQAFKDRNRWRSEYQDSQWNIQEHTVVERSMRAAA